MTTPGQIATEAMDAVSKEFSNVVHSASINGQTVGRVVQDERRMPDLPQDGLSVEAATIYCEGFIPSLGDEITYAGKRHRVTWVDDMMGAGSFAVARVTLLDSVVVEERDTADGYGGYS